MQSSDPTATPIRITDDPGAPGYQLIDPDKTHPWRQKELLEELNKSLPTKINTYDLLAVRRLHLEAGEVDVRRCLGCEGPHLNDCHYSTPFLRITLSPTPGLPVQTSEKARFCR